VARLSEIKGAARGIERKGGFPRPLVPVKSTSKTGYKRINILKKRLGSIVRKK
jgi:hypothetical protein